MASGCFDRRLGSPRRLAEAQSVASEEGTRRAGAPRAATSATKRAFVRSQTAPAASPRWAAAAAQTYADPAGGIKGATYRERGRLLRVRGRLPRVRGRQRGRRGRIAPPGSRGEARNRWRQIKVARVRVLRRNYLQAWLFKVPRWENDDSLLDGPEHLPFIDPPSERPTPPSPTSRGAFTTPR